MTEFAKRILPFAESGLLDVLQSSGGRAVRFQQMIEAEQTANKKVQNCRQLTKAWKQKIPAQDLPAAISQANSYQGSFFAWLSPAWWRLRGVMNRSYDFASHTIRPDWVSVFGRAQKRLSSRRRAPQDQRNNLPRIRPLRF